MESQKINSTNKSLECVKKIGLGIFLFALAMNFLYYQFISFEIPNFYYDPEYAYFTNSLLTFKGQPYYFIDHPGTLIEMIGTGLLAITYPFVRLITNDFIFFHLNNPIYFLLLARLSLLLFTVFAVLQFSKSAVKIKDHSSILMLLSIIASFFAFHPDSFVTLSFWSHNSFNFSAGSLLLLSIWLIFREDQNITTRHAIILGGLTGVLTTLQLYFFTWTIGAIISFGVYQWYLTKNNFYVFKISLIIGTSAIAGFIVATIPIIKEYPRFSIWLANLVLHNGLYGGGDMRILSSTVLFNSFAHYLNELLPIFLSITLLLFFLFMVIFILKLKVNKGIKSYTIGLTAQILITTLIILKHPQQIYFLAVTATIPLLLIITNEIFENNPEYRIKLIKKEIQVRKVISVTVFFITIILFISNYFASIEEYNHRKQIFTSHASLIEQTTEEYADYYSRDFEDINVLVSYQVHSACYALYFGDEYANFAFTEQVNTICGNTQKFNLWDFKIVTLEGEIEEDMLNWDLLFLDRRYIKPYQELLNFGHYVELKDNHLSVILSENSPDELVEKIEQLNQ